MKTYTLQSPKQIAERVVSKMFGGEGSGNYGHSGLDNVHGGSSKGGGNKSSKVKITKTIAKGGGEYNWKTDKAEGYISKSSRGWKVHQTEPSFDTNTYDTFKEAKDSLEDTND